MYLFDRALYGALGRNNLFQHLSHERRTVEDHAMFTFLLLSNFYIYCPHKSPISNITMEATKTCKFGASGVI
jgi:hypothetical protein